jgi:stearoyl-CoA desaturase (delta-9 desaturase)
MISLRLNWTNFTFLFVAHLLAAFAVVYLAAIHFSWWTLAFGLVYGVCCGLSITGGYHRLFSHGSYQGSWLLRAFALAFGAASVQNSALAWSADHRAHHAHTDTDDDPYDIRKGFWWAHIGWVIFQSPAEKNLALVRDLGADPLVAFQHRYYVPLAIVFGVVVPGAFGLLWGDAIGTILVAGWLRLVVQWHATFSINSLTHSFGKKTFDTASSAFDSFWIALLTFGEGYHNFHHRFPIDYRNGVRWYQFDPTKWWIWSMAKLGLARRLRRVPNDRIEAARREARFGMRTA